MHIAQYTINGTQISFAIANANDYIQKYHLHGTFYEQGHLNILKGYCRPDRTFVDVGANVGNHTLFISKFCDTLRVIPFECNPEAIDILRENLSLNECDNVFADHLGVALGAGPCAARIKNSVKDNLGGTQIEYGPAGDGGDLPVIAGDSVLLAEPVGVIKIDVELTEFEVLAGLEQTIRRWRPVLFVEIVPEKHPERDAWCAAHGYRVEWGGWDNLLLPEEA